MIEPVIIGTGSSGNATLLGGILLDCGMPYRAISPYIKQIRIVCLTHIHGDHLKKSAIRRIHEERPTVRFLCGEFLCGVLRHDCGIPAELIDIASPGSVYGYGIAEIEPIELVHNVPNIGYKLHLSDGTRAIYATDTCSLDGIAAKYYDYYFIEANHTEAEIHERIKAKESIGEYAYEYQAAQNHLSREKADEWLYANAGMHSLIYYMHEHNTKNQENEHGNTK